MDVDMSLINDIEDEEIIDPDLAIDEVIVDSTTEINERMKREIFTEGSSFLIIYEEGDEFIDKLLIVNDLNIEQDKILLKDEEQNDENLYFDTDDTLIMKNEFYTINDTWKSEDRRKLLAYARDLLNSDYGGHRLTFQLFAQSAPFAQSGAVYRNFDWDATLEFVQKSAGLSDNVFKPNKINNGDPAIQKWYENNYKEAAE